MKSFDVETTLADLKGRAVLVTGGAGFCGSNLIRVLVAAGVKVTVLDDFFTGSRKNLADVLGGVRIIEGSVTDVALVRKLVKECSIIFHLAARNIIVSTRNPREDMKTNIEGTLNLLEAARESGCERFVYASSCSVYGNSRYLPVNEDDSLNLLNPYAVSKLAGEHYSLVFYEMYELPAVTLRYSNVFGPYQDPSNPYAGVVAKFFTSAAAGAPLTVHGDGEQTRDFTFIDDAVAATCLAAVHPHAVGEMFNVGTGKETTINELAAEVIRISQSSSSVTHVDRRDIDNIRRRVLNIERIRKRLRWAPQTTLTEGLKLTWEWFQSGK